VKNERRRRCYWRGRRGDRRWRRSSGRRLGYGSGSLCVRKKTLGTQ